MQCPHCLVEFVGSKKKTKLGKDVDGKWDIITHKCPICRKKTFELKHKGFKKGDYQHTIPDSKVMIRPKAIIRPPVALEVPDEYAVDYKEAAMILTDSPKASAALSRRCLQHIIRNTMGIKRTDLFQEIQEVIDSKLLPDDILESLDTIRLVGNFTAHPVKSLSAGEIVAVEPQEAEWNLDVLEIIFEFLFIRPVAIQKKKNALNAKLRDAGRMPMKLVRAN